MSSPSEFSYLNRLWVTAFPANNVMPTGAVATPWTELISFIEGNVGGQAFTEIDDSGQDSPHAH